MQLIHQPATSDRLGEFLAANLAKPWTTFRAAVAFVKKSGTKHIESALSDFSRTGRVEIIAGVNLGGTSKEGLEALLNNVGDGRVLVFQNDVGNTFHPKLYLFKSEREAEVLIGSGNLTEGGLFTNYEASVRLCLSLTNPTHQRFLQSIEETLDRWADLTPGTALVLDSRLLARLVARGIVPVEALSTPENVEERYRALASSGSNGTKGIQPSEKIFATVPIPRAPKIAATAPPKTKLPTPAPAAGPAAITGTTGFLMTLQQTDVGKGQTTKGTARRSPEIFIPLAARDEAPDFWGWPSQFVDSATKYDRKNVRMRMGSETFNVNLMGWKLKKDLRIRSEKLRSAGAIGYILRLEKVPPSMGFDYYAELVPPGTTQFQTYLDLCTSKVKGASKKRYGYY